MIAVGHNVAVVQQVKDTRDGRRRFANVDHQGQPSLCGDQPGHLYRLQAHRADDETARSNLDPANQVAVSSHRGQRGINIDEGRIGDLTQMYQTV